MIYRVGNCIFNTFLAKQIKMNFAKMIDTSNFLKFFPPLKEKMSEPLKEGTDRTWRVAEKERRESKYRTKQVFIEHATDKSRKQEREIKHSQVKSSRFC